MDNRDGNRPGGPAALIAASLLACSTAAELIVTSEELHCRLAEAQATGARLMRQSSELRAALPRTEGSRRRLPPGHGPGPPAVGAARSGTLTGESGHTPAAAGAVMLSEYEATALAVVLRELAARHPADPLATPARQAAALLRQRVAASPPRGRLPGPAAAAIRRAVGDTRDETADRRDTQAVQRDLDAQDRDCQATERGRQANDADERAAAAEQRVRDLLWDAELRDAAAQLGWTGTLNQADRQAVRDVLSQARADRQAASRRRHADDQDRLAGQRDRQDAQADRQHAVGDRQASRADRDQSVIDGEAQDPAGA